jgi:hypothetical protein
MVRRKAETFKPVTMGHIRGHGCRDLLPLPAGRRHSDQLVITLAKLKTMHTDIDEVCQ